MTRKDRIVTTCIQTSKFLFFRKNMTFTHQYEVDAPFGKPPEFFRFKFEPPLKKQDEKVSLWARELVFFFFSLFLFT